MNTKFAVSCGFVIGLVAGGIAGAKLVEKKLSAEFEERLERETNEVRSFYKAIKKPDLNPDERADEIRTEALEAMKEYAGNGEPVAYHKIRKSSVQIKKEEEAPPKERNVFQERDERGEIYVLTGDEYEENETDYQQVTLTFYSKDGVLTDIHEDRIEDIESIIGTDALREFGQHCDDDNVVHVRNERLQLEYEIVRSPSSYAQEVLGEEPVRIERPSQRINRGE